MRLQPGSSIFLGVASVNPNDRDRGLRLVGTVTSAVAAVTLVAVGATTALAAEQTKQRDELKFVASKPEAAGTVVVPTGTGPTAKALGGPVGKTGPKKKKSTPKPSRTTSTPRSTATGAPLAPAGPTAKATTKPKTSTNSATIKPKPKPKPTTTVPTSTTTSPAAAPTTVPPSVPSTGS